MTEESTDTPEVTRTMESLIDEALKIIRNVSDKANHVFVNKNQCKWLARRFEKIGEALEAVKKAVKNDVTSSLEESAMEEILLVLKEGERLVKSYKDNAPAATLARTDNREAFDVVHEQIDELKKYLDWSDPEEATEENPAYKDRNSMDQDLGNLTLKDEKPNVDLSKVKRVISDKFRQDAVPDHEKSYLHIDFTAINLEDLIKKQPKKLNKRDEHLRDKAVVHKGQWNGCECAIKEFKSSDKAWNMEELKKEVASLVKLRHPHITQLIGRAQDEEKTYVLYERMDSDLRELIKKSRGFAKPRPFSPTEELSIIRQIAQGMFYLHQHGIVHGELKCTNLLVKRIGDDIDVKVSDFHCSRELGSNEKYKPTHRTRWLPPEAFDHFDLEHPPPHDVLKQGDVYSFAMTCCEVVTGGYPFDGIEGDEVLKGMILTDDPQKSRPKLPDQLSDDLKSLIQNCWHKERKKRPSFEEICYHLQIIVAVPTSSLPTRVLCWSGFKGNARTEPTVDDEISDEEWPPFEGESSSSGSSVESEPGVDSGLPHYLKIEPKNLKRFKSGEIGSGASAQVWATTWHGCKFAVKYMKSDHVSTLRKEVGIMTELLHPHVVRLVGFAAEGNRCAIVMELMDKSLKDFIDEEKKKNSAKAPFSEAEAIVIITQLANGMKFMHSRGVAHGDLKCANVLVRHVQTKKRNNMDVHVKLVDFGLAHLERLVVENPTERVGLCQAPEVKQFKTTRQPYDPKFADVYSFGMMCWEIISGKFIINYDTFPPKQKPGKVREDLWNLLKRCRSSDPKQRPTFPEICDELAAMSPKARGGVK